MSHDISLNTPKTESKRVTEATTLPLNINPKHKHKSGLKVGVKVALDGQTVNEFNSQSFHPLFYQALEAMMHGSIKSRMQIYNSLSREMEINSIFSSEDTVGIQFDRPFLFERDNEARSDLISYLEGGRIGLSGVTGISLNGTFLISKILDPDDTNPERIQIKNIDGSNINLNLDNYNGSGKADTFIAQVPGTAIRRKDSSTYFAISYMQSWDIIVGSSNKEEDFQDIWLTNRITDGQQEGQLQHTNVSFTDQITDKPSSQFTIVRTFQNPAGNSTPVDITEYGIISHKNRRQEDYIKTMLSRDVQGAVSVAPGSQLSVQISPRIELVPDTQNTEADGTNGGFLQGFISKLRQLAVVDSFSPDLQNHFALANAPGGGTMWDDHQFTSKEYFGIVVGTDSTFVSMTDNAVLGQILHGQEEGQLYHYGTDVGDLVINEANNTCYYEITRMFENRTNNPITISEVGLNCNANGSGLSDPYPIARFALSAMAGDQITIQPGEIKPIVLRIGNA